MWKLATDAADDEEKLTKTFSKDEIFVSIFQIKRTADSVSTNILQG